MKNILLFHILILICSISYSQNIYTQKQLEDAGFKSKTSKKIISKYNGDVEAAFNKWATSGSGSLGKKSAKAALQLGLNKSFVDSRLKKAKKVRAMMIAAALSGAAAGISEGMQKQSEIQAESIKKQREVLQNSSYSNPYGTSSYSNLPPISNPYNINSSFDNSNDIQIQGAESMNNYSIDNYGFEQKTGSLKNNPYGGVDKYEVGDYGFEQKTGSFKNNPYGGVDKYEVGDYGFEQKTGSFKNNPYGGVDEYILDKNGFEQRIKTYKKNPMGNGYDIYKIDSNGFEVKIGSVKKAPW